MRKVSPRIGIDIGRVIIAPTQGSEADTAFFNGNLSEAMKTPPNTGAFDAVKTLVEVFDNQAWLVSKAGPKMQNKTNQWLWHWDFFKKTNLPMNNIRYCLKRNEKADHCADLQINFFIDDRLDVLTHLRGCVPNLYLFGEQPKLDKIPAWVTHVLNWEETLKIILCDLEKYSKEIKKT